MNEINGSLGVLTGGAFAVTVVSEAVLRGIHQCPHQLLLLLQPPPILVLVNAPHTTALLAELADLVQVHTLLALPATREEPALH